MDDLNKSEIENRTDELIPVITRIKKGVKAGHKFSGQVKGLNGKATWTKKQK